MISLHYNIKSRIQIWVHIIILWTYKGNNGSEREAGNHRYYRAEKTTMVWPHQKDARWENTKINYGLDTTGEKEKRTSKKNMDGRSTSSHDNKKFRNRSVEKLRGMAFGFRKTATAVKKTGQIDRLSFYWHVSSSLLLLVHKLSFETCEENVVKTE